jgi:hypothetical protein
MISGVGNVALIARIFGALVLSYIVVGFLLDVVRAFRFRLSARARSLLASVLFEDEEPAGVAAGRLGRVSASVLLPLVQTLAADLDGDADRRLRRLIGSSGLTQLITRRMRSRRWRRRVQAAALAPLLSEGDPRRVKLLHDRNPTVRARAAAHLEAGDVVASANRLLDLLGDTKGAVRFSAQQALLRGDGRIVPLLAEFLETAPTDSVPLALEVAAATPDSRLHDALLLHCGSDDPAHRALAIGAVTPDSHGVDLIERMLDDDVPEVRAAAASAAGRAGGEVTAPRLGCLLSDRSWEVRLRAGQALAALGPVGALTLRHHLFDADPYARDMARRSLDDIAAREHRPVVPQPVPPGLDVWAAPKATA